MTSPAAAGVRRLPRRASLARFIGIITSPKDTFASVVAHPKWFGMLALTTVLIAVLHRAAADDAEPGGRRASISRSSR